MAATARPASPPCTIVATPAAAEEDGLGVGLTLLLVSVFVADAEWDSLWEAEADEAMEEADSDAAEEALEATLDAADEAEDSMEEMMEPRTEVAEAIGLPVIADEEMEITTVVLSTGMTVVQEGWPAEPRKVWVSK
jgi:hypothetical protein